MFEKQLLNGIFTKGFDLLPKKPVAQDGKKIRYERIKNFLLQPNFNGFTKDDLFIMQFIKKGWGHDIAALSNMAESMVNLTSANPDQKNEYQLLMKEIVFRALHPKVNPYKKHIQKVRSLGKFGYYLEHLNIILGCYQRIVNEDLVDLNEKVTRHLLKNSLSYDHYHADLLPHVKMKWSADQAAIIHSMWLFDQNNDTNLSNELSEKWINYMDINGTHRPTGLFITEVLGTRKFSNHPRGCALSYLVHYMGGFAPEKAKDQWKRYKKHMLIRVMGKTGFREYLEDYDGSWTPDSGPIIAGVGIAATGLGLNAASTIGDRKTFRLLEKSMNPVHSMLIKGNMIPGINKVSKIGTDLLSSAIWLNAETK